MRALAMVAAFSTALLAAGDPIVEGGFAGNVIVGNDVCLYRVGASWIEVRNVSGGVCGATRGTLSAASMQSWNSASAVNTAGVVLASTADINWSSTAAISGAKDAGWQRNRAGVLEETDGASGPGGGVIPGQVAALTACDATTVATVVTYAKAAANKISLCFCAQTGVATYAWESTHASGDCT